MVIKIKIMMRTGEQEGIKRIEKSEVCKRQTKAMREGNALRRGVEAKLYCDLLR